MRREVLKIIAIAEFGGTLLLAAVLTLMGVGAVSHQVGGILGASSIGATGLWMGFAIWSKRDRSASKPWGQPGRRSFQPVMKKDELVVLAILIFAFLTTTVAFIAFLPSSVHALWFAVAVNVLWVAGIAYWVWLFHRSRRTA